jgi:hypothetical protein
MEKTPIWNLWIWGGCKKVRGKGKQHLEGLPRFLRPVWERLFRFTLKQASQTDFPNLLLPDFHAVVVSPSLLLSTGSAYRWEWQFEFPQEKGSPVEW